MTYKLLIVDDELPNVRLLARLFRNDYHCLTASSGSEAIGLLEQHDVAIVITDQRMPQMTGLELLEKTAELRPHMVRIMLTGYTDLETLVDAVNCGLVYMYVPKPWNNADLKLRVSRALEHHENNKKRHSLEIANARLIARLGEMKAGCVRALSDVLKARDEDAYHHSVRVSRYAFLIGQKLELPEEECAELSMAAALHELGIISAQPTPNNQLMNEHSNSILQQLSARGANILSLIPELREMADIVRFQRENFDGSGGPRGLIGDQIPLSSRIIRVADEYDLLTNPRNNSLPVDHEQAIANLKERAGRDLDPDLVKLFPEIASEDLLDSSAISGKQIKGGIPTYA